MIGVIGTGVMGRGLVDLLLAKGHEVVCVGRNLAKVPQREGLTLTTYFDDLEGCDLVIEAVVEDLAVKTEVLCRAERSTNALLATNTSSLPVNLLAEGLSVPADFAALHFFNPPAKMRLVEFARCEKTTDTTAAEMITFATSLGKEVVEVAPTPAFIANRVLMPMLNEAVRMVEQGADPTDVDAVMRKGTGHAMGPLAVADLIGVDVVVGIMDNLTAYVGSGYEPRPLLRAMLEQGRLGRKTGSGFHEYA